MLRYKAFVGELISEFIAVLIIITIGNSAAAMYTLYDPSPYKTAYWGVCITWGLAVTIAIYVTGAVSGTHANPAVTLALLIYRKFPKAKVIPYWLAQTAGAFAGAAIVFLMFEPVIDAFNLAHGLDRAAGGAAGVFFTHASAGITPIRAFFNEIVLTAILLLGIFAITEEFNTSAPQANASALIIGLLVATIGASAGYLEAWPLNPARDLGPRIFCYLMGWGASAFPAPDQYWWVPIAGPLCGGVVGASMYQWMIRPFLPARQKFPGNGN
ncbi:MIP/aquaporin family protein [Sphingobium nicotianae]|uniref:Aquaporin family protein n=1 Tax=Sphingobium nicotianae TaxID=2782607 RepID=A0A9X1IT14_9SPHN|nr:MIP/aquaporin family protein [Sphingobium nicotianae]MBT2188789.1 aquaporin family protein [Sphingobium nicotianae]